jgi:hypothetical protein
VGGAPDRSGDRPQKTYHVQVDRLPDEATLAALRAGVEDEGEFLVAQAVRVLRSGDKTAWLEVVLDEGRNRHIRRLLAAFDLQVLRLVRVAIGGLLLGDLGKGSGGCWRSATSSGWGPLHRADHRPRPAVAGHRSRRRGRLVAELPERSLPMYHPTSTKPCAAQACCCRWCCWPPVVATRRWPRRKRLAETPVVEVKTPELDGAAATAS